MCLEITGFKKCLCCLPLRPGLLALGYLKLISMAVFILYVYISIAIGLFSDYTAFLMFVLTIVAGLDLIFDVIFICGAHLKKYGLLIAYNCYNIVLIVISTGAIIITIASWIAANPSFESSTSAFYTKLFVIEVLIDLALLYISLLVGSETNLMKIESDMNDKLYCKLNEEKMNSVQKV